MKVCILTFAVTNNYGATLQCYALSKFIQQQGHETIILNVPLQKAGASRSKGSLWVRVTNKIRRIMHITPPEGRYFRTKKQLQQDGQYDFQNMLKFEDFRKKD